MYGKEQIQKEARESWTYGTIWDTLRGGIEVKDSNPVLSVLILFRR